jgi:hypothetical protein
MTPPHGPPPNQALPPAVKGLPPTALCYSLVSNFGAPPGIRERPLPATERLVR